jgi:hypothetical protein
VTFRNPANGYTESVNFAFLWALVFGVLYFAVKGVWRHAVISFVLAVCTLGLSWLIYPFFAKSMLRAHYLRLGWVEVTANPLPPPLPQRLEFSDTKKCPRCAEFVKRDALVCRFCGGDFRSAAVDTAREAAEAALARRFFVEGMYESALEGALAELYSTVDEIEAAKRRIFAMKGRFAG